MRLLKCAALSLTVFAALSPALAAEKEFPRRGAVILLGYDPEAVPTAECEKRASIAGIIRVALVQKKPITELMAIHLNVAGLIGAARAICPADKGPPPLTPLIKADTKLDAASCRVARDVSRGAIRKTIDDYIDKEHTDLAQGFVAGVAEAMAAIARACDPGEYWAALQVDAESLARRAAGLKERRACNIWRSAGFKEIRKAMDVAEAKGRAAGSAYLSRQTMTAIAGARHYCGPDGLAEAFEKMHYDIAVAMIAATPEKPQPKP